MEGKEEGGLCWMNFSDVECDRRERGKGRKNMFILIVP